MTDDGRRSREWDVQFGTGNYAALVSSYVIAAIASLAAVYIITRSLPAASYGWIMAIIATAQLAQQLGTAWTVASIGALGGAEFIDTGRLSNVFWTRLVLLTANLGLLGLTAAWWLPWAASFLNLDRTYATAMLTYLGASSLWAHVQQSLMAAKQIRMQAVLSLTERLLMLVSVSVLSATGNATAGNVTGAYVVGALGATIAALVPLWPLITPLQMFRERTAQRIFRFSLPLLPGAVANFAASHHLSTFFLAHLIGATAVATFGVAHQLFSVAVQLPLLAGMVLQPYFVTLHTADAARSTGPAFAAFVQTFSLMMSAVCLILAVIGAPLLGLLLGESYAGAGPLLWPLLASAALAAPALLVWIPLATAMQKTYILAVNAGSTAILNVTLHWLLTPRWGAFGAAWAILISYFGTALVTVVFLRRERLPDCAAALVAALPPAIAAIVAMKGGLGTAFLSGVTALLLVTWLQREAIRRGLRVTVDLASGARR